MAFANLGTQPLVFEASGSVVNGVPTVVIRGYAENFPLVGIHLSCDEATSLASRLIASAEELASLETAEAAQ